MRRRWCAPFSPHDRGNAAVLSRVRVPSVQEEDRKRLIRERRRLVKERTSLTNSIKGLLKLHGIFELDPRARGFDEKFADAVTAYGSPVPPRARQEIERLKERLSLVERQINEVEAERDEVAQVTGRSPTLDHGYPGGQRCTGGGENSYTGPAEGDRRERRNRARQRGVLPRLPQSARARELGGHNADTLDKWRHAARPGDRPRRSGMDSGSPHPNDVALATPSTPEPAFDMV